MQTTDVQQEEALKPLLRQAFRPLFLFGALFSLLAMLLWGLAQWLPGFALYWYQLAIAGWVLAFGCYCLVYWPVLTTPRADGRPG